MRADLPGNPVGDEVGAGDMVSDTGVGGVGSVSVVMIEIEKTVGNDPDENLYV